MIRRLLVVSLFAAHFSALAAASDRAAASEPPPVVLSAEQWALYQYVYADFPRALQNVDAAIELAERRVVFLANRVEGYRPFRSFGRYGATYQADMAAQLDLVAAQQELACVLRHKPDLWRERQAIVTSVLLNSGGP